MGTLPGAKWIWGAIGFAVVAIIVVLTVFSSSTSTTDVSLGRFIADVKAGNVDTVDVRGHRAEYKLRGGDTTYGTDIEDGDSIRAILADNGVEPGSPNYPEVKSRSSINTFLNLIIQFVPVIVIIAILFFFFRQASKSANRPPLSMMVTNFDPVCRASVDPGKAAGSSTFMSTTYYFCTPEHKAQFDADPPKYLLQK